MPVHVGRLIRLGEACSALARHVPRGTNYLGRFCRVAVDAGRGDGRVAGALCRLLAGFFPAIFKALNLDLHLEGIHRAASEFTNLRDRFRRAATVSAHAPFEEFKAEFEALMDRMDAVRTAAPPTPEWCFRKAQKKIGSGDYDFDIDGKTP